MNCFRLSLYLLTTAFLPMGFAQSDSLESQADHLIQRYVDMDWFSGVVLIARDGQPIYQKAVGYADIEKQEPNTMQTLFRIGSINKLYTAILVMQEIEAGNIALDGKLGDYLDGFPPKTAEKVSIRHILGHRAGFPDIFVPQYLDHIRDYKTIDDIIPLLQNEPLLFKPGKRQEYSNYGYIVLGAILEKINGKSYTELLRERIFPVLGTEDTYCQVFEELQVESAAKSYRFGLDGEKIDHTDQLEYPTPDGGMYSTASDLLVFFEEFMYGDKLLDESQKCLWASEFEKEKCNWDFMLKGPGAFAEAGGGPGVSAMVGMIPKTGYTVIVLANTDQNVAESLGSRLMRMVLGREVPDPKLPQANFLYQTWKENDAGYLVENFDKLLDQPGYEKGPFALNEVGYMLLQEDRYQEAIAIFQANVDLFPKEANPYDSLAEAYYKSGDKENARKYYEKALEIDPDLASPKEMLGRLKE